MRVVTLDGLGQAPKDGTTEVVTEETTVVALPEAVTTGLRFYMYGMTAALAGFVWWGGSQIVRNR